METVRNVAILMQPVVPESASKMLDQLSIPEDARSFSALGEGGALTAGTPIPKPQGIFPRYVEPEINEETKG
jgi:methionyl-tRNA synthetase